jgi:hypothetical protein
MIEVFTTSLRENMNITMLESWLMILFPNLEFNSDLADQEHVLRVHSSNEPINNDEIMAFAKSLGYDIQILE